MCFRPPSVTKPRKCEECGTLNPPTATTCRKCGAEIKTEVEMVKCPGCGEMNPSTSETCSKCGFGA